MNIHHFLKLRGVLSVGNLNIIWRAEVLDIEEAEFISFLKNLLEYATDITFKNDSPNLGSQEIFKLIIVCDVKKGFGYF